MQQLQSLAAAGVDFNATDFDYRSPLQYAVRGGSLEIIEFVLKQGVDVNLPDRWASTPLDYAQNSTEITNLLLQHGAVNGFSLDWGRGFWPSESWDLSDNDMRLYWAAFYNDVKTCQVMKYVGWHLEVEDIDRRTVLHIAAAQGSFDVVKYLVKEGSVIQTYDSRGHIPNDDADAVGHHLLCHEFLDGVITDGIVKTNCDTFMWGLLKDGMS